MTYLGEEIKKLGFGLMRLPKNGEDFDIDQIKAMVDRFMESGFTYFDTAWVYPGSEDAIRQALVERYPRERYQLATKNAAWMNCETREDAIAQFDVSLKRTSAGYFDFYLLHNLGESRTDFFDRYDMWSFAQEKKRQGLIRHVGFSFHSTADELEEILTAHPEMEFVQLQLNFADWENPAIQSRACYEVARKHGKPIVVMEPVKGGMLATPPESVAEILRKADPTASVASWAIRFAASLEGIITVLSGMSNLEQMDDNISFMKDFTPLSVEEQAVLAEAQEALDSIPLIPCTVCNYCAKVCPENIGISGAFTAMNYLTLYGGREAAAYQGSWLIEGHGMKKPDQCIKCGKCEQVCPQHIAIRDELERTDRALFLPDAQ
ncbi:aldo/keto reductase [Synergistaceae bacterium OttesenSCG-928-I11]|nr:aldo/keto reductase [Synergistaceae bacterium OttesenSCG-928-I11]